mmetsp:Transcript_6399/g.15070  ORF Transcript_6399/g.15070 Transcript_6399/m.15070 type:complete len:246 (+) Transcript_6399:843-1580(+)
MVRWHGVGNVLHRHGAQGGEGEPRARANRSPRRRFLGIGVCLAMHRGRGDHDWEAAVYAEERTPHVHVRNWYQHPRNDAILLESIAILLQGPLVGRPALVILKAGAVDHISRILLKVVEIHAHLVDSSSFDCMRFLGAIAHAPGEVVVADGVRLLESTADALHSLVCPAVANGTVAAMHGRSDLRASRVGGPDDVRVCPLAHALPSILLVLLLVDIGVVRHLPVVERAGNLDARSGLSDAVDTQL